MWQGTKSLANAEHEYEQEGIDESKVTTKQTKSEM